MLMNSVIVSAMASDTKGTDYEEAVNFLISHNIMTADTGTGLFRTNDTVSRSEFAVIAVKADGDDDAALKENGATKFSDVAADHWAKGYINLAANMGFLCGYPDGTFKPDNTITYSEVIKVLTIISCGYNSDLAGKPWPDAYIKQADSAGITTGVVFNPSAGATRGNVARLVYNTVKNLHLTDSINLNDKQLIIYSNNNTVDSTKKVNASTI